VLAGAQLDAAIRSVLSRPFRQAFFRASRLRHAGDPLGGALQLTPNDLAFNFRSLPPGSPPTDTQLLGERCSALSCIDGLLFPSFALQPPTGTNIAVIEATLPILGSSIFVDDPGSNLRDRLP